MNAEQRMPSSPQNLSDRELLAELARVAANERRATVHLIALLIEMDTRRLYLCEGFSSLFTFCTQSLHLSEHAAYNRIEAARAARPRARPEQARGRGNRCAFVGAQGGALRRAFLNITT